MVPKLKKGVSPLIATVLLIAFAVSLLAVVMNLAITMVAGPCDAVEFEIDKTLCYDGNTKTVRIALTNTGHIAIDSFKIIVTGTANVTNGELTQRLEVSNKLMDNFAVNSLGDIHELKIVPVIKEDNQVCLDQEQKITKIPICP